MKEIRKMGLVCCSNGEPRSQGAVHQKLAALLQKNGIEPVFSPLLYADNGVGAGSGRERAAELMAFYRDPTVDAICDLSGGDMANEVLEWLDFDEIARSDTEFWGYSDLTVILNSIYAKTGKMSVLYQIKNLVGPAAEEQQRRFFEESSLFELPVRFLHGNHMEGTVVGGNIRCLLKLAGTEYFPDMRGKLLLLEANSGRVPQMVTYLSQLRQLGVFGRISGLILGTFTQMERENIRPAMEELVLERLGPELPVVKTEWVGHGADARAVRIGARYAFHI